MSANAVSISLSVQDVSVDLLFSDGTTAVLAGMTPVDIVELETGSRGPQGDPGADGTPVWRGAWSGTTAYAEGDAVGYGGSSYVCNTGHTNHVPPNASYWDVLAAKGDSGALGSAPTWKRVDFSTNLNGVLEDFELPITSGKTFITDSEAVFLDGAFRVRGLSYTIAGAVITTIGAASPLASGQSLYVLYQETA